MPQYAKFPIKKISNYQTGGECTVLYEPASVAELQENLAEIKRRSLKMFWLGGGTNSLVLDDFWDGAVISFRQLKKIKLTERGVYCEAGVTNSDLSSFVLQKSLSGLEWMYSLPGQLGGTIRMNARCYGGEIAQVVNKVDGVTLSGEVKSYLGDAKIFRGYKDTVFMQNDFVITGAELNLSPGDAKKMHEKMLACEQDRKVKGHFIHPSCGCVFKNNYDKDVSVPSGLLLEQAGAKGRKRGQASVSPHHANFIYNLGGANSRDILELALDLRDLVWEKFGVWLEFEMELLGQVPLDLSPRIFERRKPAYNHEALAHARALFQSRRPSY